jgi:uncharacterized protein (DUF1330 family)
VNKDSSAWSADIRVLADLVVHGGKVELLEGTIPGTLVVIEFPDRSRAEEWYASPAYQQILPLRTENSLSTTFLIDGVDGDHRATDVLH